MVGDEAIEGVRYAAADDRVPEHRSIRLHEAPAVEPFVLGQRREEDVRRLVVERQDSKASSAVEPDDDTRREAAEASAGVVQEDGTTRAHRALSNPSSVARTSGPIVSST